ncbi:hypothetical protein Tco_0447778 [Tanacetum coccineum]
MVAFLERSDENVKFHQIVNFLTTSSIHYALTVSPTIHALKLRTFWAPAKCPQYDPMAIKLVQKFDMIGWQRFSCLGKLKDCSRLGDPKAKKESQKIRKGTKGKPPEQSRDEGSSKIVPDCIQETKDDKENVSNQWERKSDNTKANMLMIVTLMCIDGSMENVG